MQPILRPELQQARLIAKTDAANLRSRILQGEIQMAGLGRAVIRYFALDPNIRKRAFDQVSHALVQLADFPNAPLWREIEEGGLAHGSSGGNDSRSRQSASARGSPEGRSRPESKSCRAGPDRKRLRAGGRAGTAGARRTGAERRLRSAPRRPPGAASRV